MKKIKGFIVCMLIIVIYIMNIHTIEAYDNIHFKNLTINDGLPQGTVEAILQDSNGYVWIGTNDGLIKYNGYDFKTYRYSKDKENSICNNYILAIKEDKKGNIWVGTSNGLSKINKKGDIFNYYDIDHGGSLSNYNICDILITTDGSILVATAQGLNLYNEKEDKFEKVLGGKNLLTSQVIYSLDQDENNNIWIGTDDGLNKIEAKSKEIKHFKNNKDKKSINENSIYKVYSDKKGYLWVGTFSSGLNKINIETDEVESYEQIKGNKRSLANNFVKNILRDSKGNIWIGTAGGLSEYIEESDDFESKYNKKYDKYSLVNNNIFSLIEDQSGLIWIGTYSGISIFDPENKIYHYENDPLDQNSISEDLIHGIYEDKDGLVWVGTSNEGVNVIDRNTNVITRIDEDVLSSNSINFITGKDDTIWVGTENGLNKINKDDKSIKIYKDGLSNNRIKNLMLDDKGYLWIGTSDGLNVLNTETDEIKDITYVLKNNSIMDTSIECIYQDTDGIYWIGSFIEGGLTKIDSKKNVIKNYKSLQNSKDKNDISYNSVRCIAEDGNGYLWIGTSYGLNKFDKDTEKFVPYTQDDGLANNTVYGILIDDDDNPWVSTNYGVSKLNVGKNEFVNFNITDGFQSTEFNGGAYYKNDKGEFFLGGVNGLNIFDPKEINIKTYCPRINYDEVMVKGEVYSDINNKKFRYDENLMKFKFFLPDFRSNKNIQYQYKLEGSDDKWNTTENNEIVYNNLAPGRYTLKVKARNHNGIMSDEKKVSFRIKYPPWLNPIAFTGYMVLIYFAIRKNRNKVKQLDRLVDQRTKALSNEMEKNKQLFDKVIQLERNKNNYFVNLSHELRTPLNVISTTQQLIEELNKNEKGIPREKIDYHVGVMKKNISRLLNLINNIIDTTKIEYGNYKVTIKKNDIVFIVEETALGLKDYIESKGIELVIEPYVEEKIIKCDRYEIERCIVNLISNATKFTEKGGRIDVIIRDLGDEVKIIIKDTGVGIDVKYHSSIFDRFNQVVDANSEVKGGSGLGLTITKHIIDLHKGNIYVESELNKGSTFTIILPVDLDKK